MKTLIWVDFVLQSVLLCTALIVLVAFAVKGSDYIMFAFILQFLIGSLQILTALVHLLASSPQKKLRTTHLILSGLYLFVYFFLVSGVDGEVLPFVLFNGVAWALAILYYVITWKLLLPRKARGSGFLPHLSF